MKLTSLRIGKFRCHRDRQFDFLPGGNILYGENFQGKSSVLDAIQFALTGACRGTDEAGRGKANLTPDGSNPVVQIAYDHSGTLPAKALLAAVLAPARFLDLDPRKQQEIVMGLSGGFPANRWGISSLEDLQAKHKAAVERRRELKRTATNPTPPEGPEVNAAGIEEAEGRLSGVSQVTGGACVLDPAITCKVSAGEINGLVERFRAELAEVEKKLGQQQVRALDYHRGIEMLHLDDTRREIDEARRLLAAKYPESDDLVRLRVRLEEVQRRQQSAVAAPANLLDLTAAREELTAVESRISKGEEIIKGGREALTAWKSYHAAAAAQASLAGQLAEVEAIVEELSPTGALAVAAQQQAQEGFPDLVNPVMAAFGFDLAIQTAPWSVTARGRDPEVLSDSERIMASVAVQYALAKLTGVNLVLVDRLEALDRGHRGALIQVVKADPTVQWVMAFTVPSPDWAPPEIPGVSWMPVGACEVVGA